MASPATVLRYWLLAWKGGDREALKQLLPPRGVVHAYEPADLAGDYAGFEAAERYFLEKARRSEGFGWEAGETTEAGPFVAVPFHLTDAAGSDWWQLAVYRVENEHIAEVWLHEWRAHDGSPKDLGEPRDPAASPPGRLR